jgi:tRNA threonylcarbamoyl adenosine modification protein YeaZ
MNILGFNQAISPSFIVFGGENEIIFSVSETPPKDSPNNLIYLVHNMFETLNIKKSSVEIISVIYGPGSFTGTRVGVVDAKMIAYALKVPLVAINSLDFIASHYNGKALVVFPAGRKEYFGAVFEDGIRLSEDAVLMEEELAEYQEIVISQDENVGKIVHKNFVKINLLARKLLDLTFEQVKFNKQVKDPLSLTPKYLHAVDVIFKKTNTKKQKKVADR